MAPRGRGGQKNGSKLSGIADRKFEIEHTPEIPHREDTEMIFAASRNGVKNCINHLIISV
jgi:hypothetical protein